MIEIDWHKDYKYEFFCPYCNKPGLRLRGKDRNNKRRFGCSYCRKRTSSSCRVYLSDLFSKVNWKRDYRVGDFICPNDNCQSRKMIVGGWKRQKKRFKCVVCGTSTLESCDLTAYNVVSRLSKNLPHIQKFDFAENQWDLRAINPNYHERDSYYCVYFHKIKLIWIRDLIKQYIYHLCKLLNYVTG